MQNSIRVGRLALRGGNSLYLRPYGTKPFDGNCFVERGYRKHFAARSASGATRMRDTKRLGNSVLQAFLLVLLTAASTCMGANLAEWRWLQPLDVTQPGLIKVALPTETLDAARSDFGDLRILDPLGGEVGHLVDPSERPSALVQQLRQMDVSVRDRLTVVQFTNLLTVPLQSVLVESPASSFIKGVTIEVASGAGEFATQSTGQLLFRQLSGAQRTTLQIAARPKGRVRLTLDDARSQPIPLTSLQLQGAAVEEVPPREHPVTIVRREEGAGETRLLLDFGGRHLQVSELVFTVQDPVFIRAVSLISQVVEDEQIKEKSIGGGTIVRGNGSEGDLGRRVTLESRIPQRQLWLSIRNDDSPPLKIDAIKATVRPAFLIFQAGVTGTFTAYTGNAVAQPPVYDISRLRAQLKASPLSDLVLGPLRENPGYRPVEALADVPLLGRELDTSKWAYRKEVVLKEDGIQELELDLEVLAHAQPGGQDLRLMQSGQQVPYIVEHSALTRPVNPKVTSETDAKRPSVQRWTLVLPLKGSPVNQLRVTTATPLFQRDLHLYEQPVAARGESYRHELARGSWTRTPEQQDAVFRLSLGSPPVTETLILEVDNGDNPPLTLQGFQFSYPVTRILFKAGARDRLDLYYGHGQVARPRYDLTLMGRQVLQADRKSASLGIENRLGSDPWQAISPLTGVKGVLFWGVLLLVVAGLLAIVVRLLPKKEA